MCNLTTDYEMQLAVLKAQNEGWYANGDWQEIVIEERTSDDELERFKVIDVKSHSISFYFDMEGRMIDIINYKW